MEMEEIMIKYEKLEREKEKETRLLLKTEWLIAALSLVVLFGSLFVSAFFEMETGMKLAIIGAGILICFVGFVFCIKIEQIAGYFECKHCKHKHIPTFASASWSMHIGRTRYMKCPKCGKKSWQKKRVK